ncbi:MAG: GNAT family N-acetyltransferase [Clostridia bacterium]|nr:GNAT family N-acetyltransferase [Clostridia bacterium]
MERILTKHKLIETIKKPASDTRHVWTFMKLLIQECESVNNSDIVVDYNKSAKNNNSQSFESLPSLALTDSGKLIGIVPRLMYRLHDLQDRTSCEMPFDKQTASNVTISRFITRLRLDSGENYYACRYIAFEAYGLRGKNDLEYLGQYCITDNSPSVHGGIYVDNVGTKPEYRHCGIATTLQKHAFEYIQKNKLIVNNLNQINVELDCVSSIFAHYLYLNGGFKENKGLKKLYDMNYIHGSNRIPTPLIKNLSKDDDYSNKLGCPLNAIKPRLHNKIRIMDNEDKSM